MCSSTVRLKRELCAKRCGRQGGRQGGREGSRGHQHQGVVQPEGRTPTISCCHHARATVPPAGHCQPWHVPQPPRPAPPWPFVADPRPTCIRCTTVLSSGLPAARSEALPRRKGWPSALSAEGRCARGERGGRGAREVAKGLRAGCINKGEQISPVPHLLAHSLGWHLPTPYTLCPTCWLRPLAPSFAPSLRLLAPPAHLLRVLDQHERNELVRLLRQPRKLLAPQVKLLETDAATHREAGGEMLRCLKGQRSSLQMPHNGTGGAEAEETMDACDRYKGRGSL